MMMNFRTGKRSKAPPPKKKKLNHRRTLPKACWAIFCYRFSHPVLHTSQRKYRSCFRASSAKILASWTKPGRGLRTPSAGPEAIAGAAGPREGKRETRDPLSVWWRSWWSWLGAWRLWNRRGKNQRAPNACVSVCVRESYSATTAVLMQEWWAAWHCDVENFRQENR